MLRVQLHAPATLYPRERPSTHCTGGWVGPRAGLDRCGNSRPHQDSIPGPSSPQSVAIPTEISGPLRCNNIRLFASIETTVVADISILIRPGFKGVQVRTFMRNRREVLYRMYLQIAAKYCICFYFFKVLICYADCGGPVVKVLCYKPEGCWFDPRWCYWKFH